jgi:hypothetical protein
VKIDWSLDGVCNVSTENIRSLADLCCLGARHKPKSPRGRPSAGNVINLAERKRSKLNAVVDRLRASRS